MGGITPKNDNKGNSAGLSVCTQQVINACISEGVESGAEAVLITSPKKEIMEELFTKRQLVLANLREAGYTVVVSEFDPSIANNGWSLHDRPIERVPDKLKTGGKPLHVRAEISAKSYKLWVYL